jgi:hypothetical protein
VTPLAPKREPATEIPDTVTDVVPLAVRTTGSVAVCPTRTLPKLTVAVLTLNVVVGASSWSCAVADPSFATAARVTVVADVTAETFAVKEALAAFRATVTLDGADTAGLLLVKATVTP